MSNKNTVLLCCAALAACNHDPEHTRKVERQAAEFASNDGIVRSLAVRALPVTVDEHGQLIGKWEIISSDLPTDDPINTLGSGGACLIQKLQDYTPGVAHSCTNPAQCGVPHDLAVKGYAPYCAEGSCWVRPPSGMLEHTIYPPNNHPDSYFCNRSIDYAAQPPTYWPVGVHSTNLVPVNPNVPSEARTTHWRTAACLRGYLSVQNGDDICGSDIGRIKYGPVLTFQTIRGRAEVSP